MNRSMTKALLKELEGIEPEEKTQFERRLEKRLELELISPNTAFILLDVKGIGTVTEYRKAVAEKEGILYDDENEDEAPAVTCEDCGNVADMVVELLGDGLGEGLVFPYCQVHFDRRVWGL